MSTSLMAICPGGASRYLLLVALPDGLKAEAVQPALRDALRRVSAQLRRYSVRGCAVPLTCGCCG